MLEVKASDLGVKLDFESSILVLAQFSVSLPIPANITPHGPHCKTMEETFKGLAVKDGA